MRIRDGLWVVMLSACAINADPRDRPIAQVQRDGHGGWVVVERTAGDRVEGELIAAEPDAMRVLDGKNLVTVPRWQIARAELWAWETQHGREIAWGAFGGASTITHGYLLIFSLPTWLLTTAVTTAIESKASQLVYPNDSWQALGKWARFPQGLPVGIDAAMLVHQDR